MSAPRPGSAAPEPLSQTLRSLRSLVLLLCLVLVSGSEVQEGINAESWLRQFGYLSQASRQMSTMSSSQVLSRAIADMQRFYGLQVTGEMDPATVSAMRRPRCGLPDRRPEERREEAPQGSRRRRYTLTGQQWDKDHLTYSLLKQQIPASLGEGRTSAALRKAFDVWSQATPLTFQEVPAHNNNGGGVGGGGGGGNGNGSSPAPPLADILLLFASGFHGDMALFDGEGGSLAHAYYPGPGMGGDTHFDADEPWTLDHQDPAGIDLFLVAVHELGHALGLEHSDHPDAVMAPFYRWTPTDNFSLTADDRAAIQYIYGPPLVTDAPPTSAAAPPPDGDEPSRPPAEEEPTAAPPPPRPTAGRPPAEPSTRAPDLRPPAPPRPTVPEADPRPVTPAIRQDDPHPHPPPQPPPAPPRPSKRPDHVAPDICEGDFDSVAVLRGEMFVFKGRWFWRVRRNRVLDNYPMPISVFWNGLPNDIDAVYERHDGKFVFFKGERYWVFREADVLPGYPQPLREYGRGLPEDHIDTVIWWEPNEHTYIFKGDRYWRYHEETRQTDKDFPKALSRWGKIPSSPKGVFLSDDGAHTYFYKGSSYWRFDNDKRAADPGYPRSILKDFMGCRNAPDPAVDPETERTAPPPPKAPPKAPPRDGPTRRDRGKDAKDVPGDGGTAEVEEEEEEEADGVVVVTVPEDVSRVMTLVMVVVPLVLVVCILALVYAILRSLQKKETPRVLVHCKRSLQDWV